VSVVPMHVSVMMNGIVLRVLQAHPA